MNPPALNGKFAAWVSIFRPRKCKPISDIVDFADQDAECATGFSKWLGSGLSGAPPPLRRHVTFIRSLFGPDGVKEPVIEALYRVALNDGDAISSDLFYLKLGDVDSITHSSSLRAGMLAGNNLYRKGQRIYDHRIDVTMNGLPKSDWNELPQAGGA